MLWITRERPKIDRIACPWLVLRHLDPTAQFLFVPPAQVAAEGARTGAIPFDVPGVELSHDGELCTFDVMLRTYKLDDPVLGDLAVIVRGADTDRHDLAPQCAGLLAISLGLGRVYQDDQELLRQGLVIYDALYAWLRDARDERHTWQPGAYA